MDAVRLKRAAQKEMTARKNEIARLIGVTDAERESGLRHAASILATVEKWKAARRKSDGGKAADF